MKQHVYHKIFSILFASLLLLISACEKEEVSSSSIYVLVSQDETIALNSGFPGMLIAAEGSGLSNIQSIVFDGKVPSIFNPALNSDKVVMFTVPFSIEKGSRFGVQEVSFTKENGQVLTTEFNLLQPDPVIGNFDPELPAAGTPVRVKGTWFQNVTQVTFGGITVAFEEVSDEEIIVSVPEGVSIGADLTITTEGGSDTKFMPIDSGFQPYLISDFDGGGLRPNNNWTPYGDYESLEYNSANGYEGNYGELIWTGDVTNGYVGCQSSDGDSFMTASNPDEVFFLVEVNCNGAVGSIAEFFIVDGNGINWAYRHVFEADGWQTIEAPLSAFGYQFNPDDQDNGDVDPSDVNQVKVALAEWSGVIPSIVRFDNIRFHVYE